MEALEEEAEKSGVEHEAANKDRRQNKLFLVV
jgi:hypothetical protein